MALDVSTPLLIGLASGSLFFLYFISFDRLGVLAFAAVIGYWALFACTYLILGRPGRDWQLPVDVHAIAATVGAMLRVAIGHARGGLAVLGARATTAARGAWHALAATVSTALAGARPPPRSHAVARSGDRHEAGASASASARAGAGAGARVGAGAGGRSR